MKKEHSGRLACDTGLLPRNRAGGKAQHRQKIPELHAQKRP